MSNSKKAMNAAEHVAEKSVEKKRPVKKAAEEKEIVIKQETKPEPKSETKPEPKPKSNTEVVKTPAKPKKKQITEDVTVHIQFAGKSYTCKDLVKIAKNVWVYDLGKKAGDFKSLELYVKPEENAAYYVINDSVKGRFFV